MTPRNWQHLPSESTVDQADVGGYGTTHRPKSGMSGCLLLALVMHKHASRCGLQVPRAPARS
jgi:hypothetical protein